MLTDSVPENTEYVNGGDKNEDGTLKWTVKVSAGESVTVSYTVKVNTDEALYDGGTVASTTAAIGDIEAMTDTIYIERTLNKVDIKFLDTAIDALSGSSFSDFILA